MRDLHSILDEKVQDIPWEKIINFGELKKSKITYKKLLDLLCDEEKYSTIHPIIRTLINAPSTQYKDQHAYRLAKTIVLTIKEETGFLWLKNI